MTLRDVAQPIARGRESDVFLRPDGLLVKRARTGRDLVPEAELMRHLHAHGIPVPRVHDASERDLVMEYVPGPRMSQEVDARPWRAAALGRQLADLHRRLDTAPVPDFLPGSGALLHLDLHPGNVVLGPDGPVVVDWASAARGDRMVDVALSWLAIAVTELRAFKRVVRGRLVQAFLAGVDDTVRHAMPEAAEIRLSRYRRDAAEVAAVNRLVAGCAG
ncbi:phosphotransferase [Saccharothrix violaceirubra]|uniref:Aminoglycoside phosphotransferase (APT) family kinase protein n=1 Tax=Saccharothrix violaceirubra TaxID=413306 RepID=A0A7W7SYB9_9PSEU|nr:phosphotransferase [Saccharothrix violaceirubra]MBB4963202.1 aminoglycoside phosphotransferase (APT) family kinase protein [Saccharothrix violaceirubra]